ncbi:MAG TPA: CHASE3 domain-containing protein [Acidimicrobiales bacterium]|nr:CHASE3 domain-containing protein [Acidimicrobiales bacterium]
MPHFRLRPPLRSLRGQVLAVVAMLVALLAAVGATTLVAGLRVHSLDRRTNDVLFPAQEAAAGLLAAYVDEQTAERGFLLTGDAVFLQRYQSGQAAAARYGGTLASLLADDAGGRHLLTATDAAAARWEAASAAPEIAAKQNGTLPSGSALVAESLAGKTLFDQLRASSSDLADHIADLVSGETAAARRAQTVADWCAGAALALAGLTAGISAFVLRRSLNRPIGRLVRAVRSVAGGNFDEPVTVSGPAEVAAIAEAVDEMRSKMRKAAETEADTARLLAVYAEGERIAGDLHDTVIQRLFAVGLQLQAMAAAYPKSAPAALSLVDELDRSIRDLRTVIFGLSSHRDIHGLRDRVGQVVRDSARGLGFEPSLTFDGPVDTAGDDEVCAQLVPALTEMLSNVARHARATAVEVFVGVVDGNLLLRVTDDGVGMLQPVKVGSGLRNLPNRAESLGGSFSVRNRTPGGTTVEWSVPIGDDHIRSEMLDSPV